MTTITPIHRHVCDAVADAPVFVGVRYGRHPDTRRIEKTPVQPNGRTASTTAPHTWRTLAAVADADERAYIDGIGIVVTGRIDADGTQLITIDIDAAIDERTGAVIDTVRRIIADANTTTEISVSGTGVHMWLRIIGGAHFDGLAKSVERLTDAPRLNGRTPAVELFTHRAYIAMTGRPYGHVRPVRTVSIDELRHILRHVAALAARIQHGPPHDAVTPRGRIPRAITRILNATHYPSTSEKQMAVIGAAVNHGWADARIIAFVLARPELHTARALAAKRITHAQATARISAEVEKARTRGQRTDATQRQADADTLRGCIDAMRPGELTTPRAHETDAAILRTIVAVIHRANVDAVAVAIRDIELRIGASIGRAAVANGIRRLTSAGWITRQAPAGGIAMAAVYALGKRARHTIDEHHRGQKVDTNTTPVCVSVHFLSAGKSAVSAPDTDAIVGPLITAVMTHRRIRAAAGAWRALVALPMTTDALAAALGVSVRTARRHVAALAAQRLAYIDADGRKYAAATDDATIDAAAERLGIGARRDARYRAILAERDGRTARSRAQAAERATAHRMMSARMNARKHAMNTHQERPNADETHAPTPTTQHAATGHPGAKSGAVTVAVTADGGANITASVTTNADTLATLGGIAQTAAALRAAVIPANGGADTQADAAALFGQPVAVTPLAPAPHR